MATTRIIGNIEIEGENVVQFNGSNETRKYYATNRSYDTPKGKDKKDVKNISIAEVVLEQKEIEKDGEKKIVPIEVLALTSDGIRHCIHREEHSNVFTGTWFSKDTAIRYIAGLGANLRGYVCTEGLKEIGYLKRKSDYQLTFAKDHDALITLGFHGTSEAKTEKEAGSTENAHNFYSRERCGKTLYRCNNFIFDLEEAAFISVDNIADRISVPVVYVKEYITEFSKNIKNEYERLKSIYDFNFKLPTMELEVKSYRKITDETGLVEKGILLPPEYVVVKFYYLINKIQRINWHNTKGGFAKFKSIKLAKQNERDINELGKEPNKEWNDLNLVPSDISVNYEVAQ
jgi:hypothetical protein